MPFMNPRCLRLLQGRLFLPEGHDQGRESRNLKSVRGADCSRLHEIVLRLRELVLDRGELASIRCCTNVDRAIVDRLGPQEPNLGSFNDIPKSIERPRFYLIRIVCGPDLPIESRLYFALSHLRSVTYSLNHSVLRSSSSDSSHPSGSGQLLGEAGSEGTVETRVCHDLSFASVPGTVHTFRPVASPSFG